MKKGRVLSIKKLKLNNIKINDAVRFFLTVLLTIGILLGILFFKEKSNVYSIVKCIFDKYYSYFTKYGFLNSFIGSFLVTFCFDMFVFFSGISIIGVITIPLFVALFGYLVGNLVSYIYFAFSLKGIAFNAVVVIPVFILFLWGLIFTAKYLFEFSLSLSKIVIKNDTKRRISEEFSRLIKILFIFVLFTVAAVLLNSILGQFVMPMFNF